MWYCLEHYSTLEVFFVNIGTFQFSTLTFTGYMLASSHSNVIIYIYFMCFDIPSACTALALFLNLHFISVLVCAVIYDLWFWHGIMNSSINYKCIGINIVSMGEFVFKWGACLPSQTTRLQREVTSPGHIAVGWGSGCHLVRSRDEIRQCDWQ